MTSHPDTAVTPMSGGEPTAAGHPVNRRSLLRRGGAIVAGVAGASMVGAAFSTDASAASGDPLALGTTNDAGTASTSVTSASASSTVALSSTANGAPLVVTPQALQSPTFQSAPPGGIGTVLTGGPLNTPTYADPYFIHDNDGTGPVVGRFNTDINTETVVGISPVRVLDTRSAAGRANIVSGAANLDSSGRLKAGTSIVVQLSSAFSYASVIFGNVTVAGGSVAAGYATVWPEGGTVPTASTVNFPKGGVIANAFTVAAGFEDTNATRNAPTLRLFAFQTTHLVLDITAAQTLPLLTAAATPAATPQDAASRRRLAARNHALARVNLHR
jgi:hypothetical protein